jgi:hypothetical protein
VGTIGLRSKRRTGTLRKQLRRIMSVAGSLGSMLVGSAIVGFAIAAIALPIASLDTGGVVEGRSGAAGSQGWVDLDERGERGGREFVGQNDPLWRGDPERWAPRGEARICRTWCVVGGDACLDVCDVARGREFPAGAAALAQEVDHERP